MITLLLIVINLIVYFLMVFSGAHFFAPTTGDILAWGGCSSGTILHGEPWRLVTAMFVHFGIFHLLMNLYALYDLGKNLEKIIGKVRFLTVYLATGIFGGLVSQLWHLDSYIVEAGASGGVFGIIGALIALLTTKIFPEEVRTPYLKRILSMVALNLVYGMQGSVNMAAHMGGLISGFLLGYGLYLIMVHENRNPERTRGTLLLIPLITLFSVSVTLKQMKSSDFFKFDEIVAEMDAKNFQTPKDDTEALHFFRTVVIPEWERRSLLIAGAQNLQLSGDKAKNRDYLEKWVDLSMRKVRTLDLKLSAMERHEDDLIYDRMIQVLDDQLAKLDEEK
jgi:rhomboid protease GluP